MRGTPMLRPSGHSIPVTRSAVRAPLVALAVIALLTGCAGPGPTPTLPTTTPFPSPIATPGAPSPEPASPSPTSAPEGWTRVDASPLPEAARLEPTRAGIAGVAVDTAFRLTSLDGRAPADLARAIVTTPAVELAVASVDGATAVLRPTTALRPATTYRISLARPDGTTEATWAAVTAGPLEVTDSVPGDQATRVPRDTGIEVTFNQYGVTTSDFRSHFSISPKTAGTFVAGGRTIAFAPTTPLRRGTLYTVTIRRGLPLAGTGETLDHDVVIRFETRKTGIARVTVGFRHALADANPRERAAITLDISRDDNAKLPRLVPLTIHRLAGLDAAVAAWRVISTYPQWTVASNVTPVKVTGLPRAWKGNATVRVASNDTYWIRLPRLAAGWYVVTERWGGIPRQVVLQVTDVSAFALAASDRTAVWVNDIATGGPIAGASVTLDGARVGRTDERGLLAYDTPSTPADAPDRGDSLVVIRDGGRASMLALDPQRTCGTCWEEAGNQAWWRTLGTDRVTYRSTDTINAWGVARNRDTARVPRVVSLELRAADADSPDSPAIAATTATPDANGAFTAAIPFSGLPVGSYLLQFHADGTDLGETWLEVATIVKPAYRLDVETSRHAVIRGQTVTATIHATFFEGTPVAGTKLTVVAGDTAGTTARTNATGVATAVLKLPPDIQESEQWSAASVTAHPTLPEEADISAGTEVAVFRSSAIVDSAATIDGTHLAITGSVSSVAFDRYEASIGDPWSVDPHGAPRAGATVRITLTERTAIRTQRGTRYDFIRKVVVPVYEYDERTLALPDHSVTTRADGTFRLVVDVRGGSNRSYTAIATYRDEHGRSTASEAWAETPGSGDELEGVDLERADGRFDTDEYRYSVGDPVRVRLTGGAGHTAGSRYLFAVTARGLAYVTTGTSPTFRTTFKEDWLPGFAITGVRFNGTGYEAAIGSYRAHFRLSDRELTVAVVPDRKSYAPGDTATLTVRVTDTAGRPAAATALVRVVDEKLFATGAAFDTAVAEMLYEQVDSGIRTWGSTHRTPWDDLGWGKGDTTGGGEGGDVRDDFRDWLLSTAVTTGADGTATVRVPLADDLTSWHVSVAAVTKRLEAGQGTRLLPVALPFFVEATVAPEYLTADLPMIRVRGFGAGLTAADTVTFRVSSETLPLAVVTRTARAFEVAEIPLPPLSAGTHRLRIEGSVGSGASRRSDALIRTFTVVTTRATRQQTSWTVLDGPYAVDGGAGLTTLVLADAGRGRVVPLLEELRVARGSRADELLAAALADRTLRAAFGIEETDDPSDMSLAPYIMAEEGLSILPYASGSLDVTVLAAMSGDPRVNPQRLREQLRNVVGDPDMWPRDRRILALAGLAALGEPVLPEVRGLAARRDLTIPERISLALAALEAGDEALAGTLERAVLAKAGERHGPWVRVDPGTRADASLESARLAIVAASLGDPVAADIDAWLADNPSGLTSLDLERALAAAGWAARVPAAAASATVTVDGTPTVVTLSGGQATRLVLTPAQAADATVEPGSGRMLVVRTTTVPYTAGSLTRPAKMTVERTVTPSGTVGPTDTVVVRLRVTLGPDARNECWRLTDLVPSGLAPIQPGSLYNDETGAFEWSTAYPDFVDGQRVEFCVSRDPKRPTQQLRYVARVVNAGSYAWEPAILQSTAVPNEGVVVPASTLTIAGLGS